MTNLILYSLATWRLASLVSREEGPYNIFGRIRNALGVKYDERSEQYGENELAKGLLCMWCCSVWFGAIWAAFNCAMTDTNGFFFIPSTLAYSAGAILIDEVLAWLERQ